MSTKEWLPYFPELETAADLAALVEVVSVESRPDPTVTDSEVVAVESAAGLRLRSLVRDRCPQGWPFVWFALDLTEGGLVRLVDELDRHPVLLVDDDVLFGLLKPVLGRVQDHMIRTLVTELHARAGTLPGGTPEDRFEAFVGLTATVGFRGGFRARYPVLVADLDRIVANAAHHLMAILDAVRADLPSLTAVSDTVRPDDHVVAVESGNGDAHRRGRSVAVVEFASGARIVFKPRSVQVDQRFQALLLRLNPILGLGLHTPRILDCREHGWMEFVEYTALVDAHGARSYYERIGYLTALLFTLDTCDIHYENVICHGDSPVLIDLETMFHPAVAAPGEGAGASAADRIGARLARSVTAIGILPTVIGDGDRGMDIGGVGFEAGQETPYKVFSFVNFGRDDMRIAFDRHSHDNAGAVPQLSEDLLAPSEVSRHVRDGFVKVITWVMGNKVAFVAMVEDLFSGVEVRYLHNPTYFYAQLLRMCTHPSLLADPQARHTLLHRVALRRTDSPPAVTRAEHRDLSGGDVPYFTLRTDSTALFDSFGDRIGDLLDATPLSAVVAKIDMLDERERDAQVALIAGSFVNKFPPASDRTGFVWTSASGDDRDERLAEAVRIGDGLLDSMVGTKAPLTTPNWLSAQVSHSEEQLWRPGPLSYDLYGGVTGVAYFLAMLGRVSGETRFADAALEVFTPLSDLLAAGELTRDSISVGAFLGTAGIAYALAHAGRALGDAGLTTAGWAGMPQLDELVRGDTLLDVVGGAGGLLAVALSMHKIAGSDDQRASALTSARSAYRHLAGRSPALNGNPDGEVLFSGFAHGVGGLYPYLARYARLTDDGAADRDMDTLLGVQGTMWDGSDWYTSTLRVQRAYGWCHGSPGILLGLCLLDAEGTGHDLTARIAAARDRTLERGFGNNVSYCHGDFGNLEILRHCAQVTDDRELDVRVSSASSALFRHWVDDVRGRDDVRHLHANSMLVGTSGIGFALLRSVAGDQVPPLLWLE